MNKMVKMLAFDFGASSGRAILGMLEDNVLHIEEIHRFANEPVEICGSLHWDILRLFHEIKQGIRKCISMGHSDIESIGVDTWGVDFGLLDGEGRLLGNPYHYRDKLTNGMMDEVFRIIPREDVFEKTGIQFMKLNTIFQLYAMKHQGFSILKEAKTMLLTPDLLNYFLTGIKVTEYSIASTTQLLDCYTRNWSKDIIKGLGIPEELFTEITESGTIIGKLRKEIAEELGCRQIPVIAVAGHDTQSAIASVPASKKEFVYISSGTWSLMGIESETPIINEESYNDAFTNEGGVGGKITFLKNIMGLWLVQECRRQWDREGSPMTFAELISEAEKVEPFVSFVNPDDESFISPGNLPERIRANCKKNGQDIPHSKGEIIRCITQSLAMKYRFTLESLERISGKHFPQIHIVGGGIQDRLLCQFTANATSREIIAGPVEATAIGNIMIQAKAMGRVRDMNEIRSVVGKSFSPELYKPTDIQAWDAAYEKFRRLVEG